MGSATTHALRETVASLNAQPGVTLESARELFAAARTLADNPALLAALADAASPVAARQAAAGTVFAAFGPATRAVIGSAVAERWSSARDLVDAVEEVAIRAASAASPGADVEQELFQVGRVIAANPDLELALGSRLGDRAQKGALVTTVLAGMASEPTVLVASSIVQQPGERRVREVIARAVRVVADQQDKIVATVSSAVPLTAEQHSRLAATLSDRYGRGVSLNSVVDPDVVGGVRIEIGGDVIDATVASRLADLRQRLAG